MSYSEQAHTHTRAQDATQTHSETHTRTLTCTWLMPSHCSARHTHKPVKPQLPSNQASLCTSCSLSHTHCQYPLQHDKVITLPGLDKHTCPDQARQQPPCQCCSLLPSPAEEQRDTEADPYHPAAPGLGTSQPVEARAGWLACLPKHPQHCRCALPM